MYTHKQLKLNTPTEACIVEITFHMMQNLLSITRKPQQFVTIHKQQALH